MPTYFLMYHLYAPQLYGARQHILKEFQASDVDLVVKWVIDHLDMFPLNDYFAFWRKLAKKFDLVEISTYDPYNRDLILNDFNRIKNWCRQHFDEMKRFLTSMGMPCENHRIPYIVDSTIMYVCYGDSTDFHLSEADKINLYLMTKSAAKKN